MKPFVLRFLLCWVLVLTACTHEHSTPRNRHIKKTEETSVSSSQWNADWIWSAHGELEPSLVFQKQFLIRQTPTRAVLSVSAIHIFSASINNREILSGSNFSADETSYYQTVEIDPTLLTPSTINTLNIQAHWLGAGQGRPAKLPALKAKLKIFYDRENYETISTNSTWLHKKSPWIRNIPDRCPFFRNNEGVPFECIDRSASEEASWAHAVTLTKTALPSTLTLQTIKLRENLIEPLTITNAGNFIVADFGKIYPGRPIVEFKNLTKGAEVVVTGAYRLTTSGEPVTHEQVTDLRYIYTAQGDTSETFIPYWYIGTRYVAVSGVPRDSIVSIKLRSRRLDLDENLSAFSSSNDTLNKLWELARHSALYSAQEQFIDTPTREQGQFSYDSYLTGMTLATLYNDRILSKQALKEFAQSQSRYNPPDGRIDAAFPNGGVVQDIAEWSLIWPIWLYEYFKISGDINLLRELFPAALRTGEWASSKMNPTTGLLNFGSGLHSSTGFVDWPDRYGYDLNTSERTVINGYGVQLFNALSEIAATLHKEEKAEKFRTFEKLLRKNIEQKLWSHTSECFVDGLYDNGKQSTHTSEQSNAMMISLELGDKPMRDKAQRCINPSKPSTSMIMSRYLVDALGKLGDTDGLMNYLTVPNGRNFADILQRGATFTFESWKGHTASAGEGESESHGYGAFTIIKALRDHILGVRCLNVGCTEITLTPALGAVDNLNAQFPNAQGTISIQWFKNKNIEIQHPKNTQITVKQPHGYQYDVVIKTPS